MAAVVNGEECLVWNAVAANVFAALVSRVPLWIATPRRAATNIFVFDFKFCFLCLFWLVGGGGFFEKKTLKKIDNIS